MMNRHPRFLFALFLLGTTALSARPARAADPAPRELRIDPGTTDVPLGEARLNVEPLVRVSGKDSLQTAYRVDITPWTFKSEAGRFSVDISDADLRRLADGAPVHFAGQAVSRDGSNTSAVQGRASPVPGQDGGTLRVQVDGKKGKLVFHTTYHLVK